MKLQYWLTWKRGRKLLPRWIIGTFPLFITLAVGTIFSTPLPDIEILFIGIFEIGIFVSILAFIGVIWFTKTSGETLYFPPLHGWSGTLASAVSLELLAISLTYAGYLFFSVPLDQPWKPTRPDKSIGLALASAYALFLGGYRSQIVQGDSPVHKSTTSKKIRRSLQNIRSSDPNMSDTDQLIDGLLAFADEYSEEPLMENANAQNIIRAWCNECGKSNSLSSRLRMIPGTGKQPTTDRTAKQVERFRCIENDLRVMSVIETVSE